MSTPTSNAPPPQFVARAGTLVGSYRLERRIGAGGMGEVWLGRHVVSKGIGAVKLLHPRLAQRADAAALFAREQSALLRLSHPHTVPVFEVSESHIAMAYIDGASLARRLRSGITPALAFRVARQIASALAQAHGRGVLHLDVKPSNILMDAAGNAYLADFGAAFLLEEAGTSPDPIAGTPGYLAPERAYGDPIGPAADQFALGRTLVAALLGAEKLPVWGSEVASLPASIPEDARAVVARSVAVDPAARFASLAAFEEALAACNLDGLAPHITPIEATRSAEPYAWAARAVATETMAPEIVRADYIVDERAALPDAELARFRERTGLRATGFSLYGQTKCLGAEPGPSWLARAKNLVVLIPGYAMARECWSDMALALVRDNPDTIVAAIDHSGFGDSAFLHDPPAWEHVGYAAITRMVLAWTELIGVAAFPTVFLGHSLGATGLALLPDDAFGPHRARILLTPMFRDLVRPPPPRWRVDLTLSVMRVVLSIRALYRAYFTHRFGTTVSGRLVTAARRRAMVDEATKLPVRTHTRLGASVSRPEPLRGEGLRRMYFVLGANDPEATPDVCDEASQYLGVRADRFRWLASGCHYPHLETADNPEGTLRNRHELVLLVDEALEEARPARTGSTEFAETEIATPAPQPSTRPPPPG